MSTYRVTARRSGDWWALEVPDLPGVHSQTKRLDRAASEAREAISLMLDVEADSIEVEVETQLPPEAREVLQAVARAHKAAEAAALQEREAMVRAASVLTQNLSQRDAGEVMGVSFQRISQLLKSNVSRPSVSRGKQKDRKEDQTRDRRAAKRHVG
ncbi:type II toxin-antitoxin system HicB family antitoxin [Streptomyces sp. NBC_00433]